MTTNTDVSAPVTEDVTQGEAQASPSVEDMAAHDYQRLIPAFYAIVDHMPKKQMLRVIKALIEYPLENQAPKFSYEGERNAFYIGMQLFDCKLILMNAVIKMTKDKEATAKFKVELDLLEKQKNENL